MSSAGEHSTLCFVCNKTFGTYTCPRCGRCYCSSDCYRHSKHAECSESFYKEQVSSAMKDMQADSTTRKQMLQLLKKHHEDEIDDVWNIETDMADEIAALVEDISLENDADLDLLWERLPEHIKSNFLQQVEDENSSLMSSSLIEPWWISNLPQHRNLVQSVQTSSDEEGLLLPSVLGSKEPSKHIPFNAINITCCYTILTRKYNFSHNDADSANDFVQDFIQMCAVFKEKYVCEDVGDALHQVLMATSHSVLLQSCNDLKQILTSDQALLLLFKDLLDTFESYDIKHVSRSSTIGLKSSQVKGMVKTCWFYWAWWHDVIISSPPSHTKYLLDTLCQSIQDYHKEISTFLQEQGHVTSHLSKSSSSLIQEL